MGCCISAKPKSSLKAEKSRRFTEWDRGTFVNVAQSHINDYYTFESTLGQGAHGKVFLATHKSTGLKRAVKSIPIKRADMIEQEIDILRETDHPHIVKIFEIIEDSKHVHIIMEYCEGGELFDRIIEQKSLSENQAAKYFKQVVEALIYLHDKGIVHRDLKPENLLLSSKSEKSSIKLADFGVATRIDPRKLLSNFVGTSYYIAPEVIMQSYNEKCDVWSLGVILYIMLSGVPPFNDKCESDILEKILNDKLEFDKQKWQNVSSEAINLLKKILVKDPNQRPSVEEILLDPWIEKRANDKLPDHPIAVTSLTHLSNFHTQTRLHRATLVFIASQLVSKAEIKELERVFKALDKNHDGKLSRVEIENGFDEYGVDFDIDLNEIFEKCGADSSSCINYTYFLTCALDWNRILSIERLKEVFKAYDLDENGYISLEELHSVFGEEEENQHFFLEIIQEADKDGDNQINFEEFVEFIMKKGKTISNRI